MKNLRFSFLAIFLSACICSVAQSHDTITEEKDSLAAAHNDSVKLSMMLDSVLVVGSNVVHYADRDVWRITKKMRRGASNTAQMLASIPGIDCNYATNDLTYYGRSNILLLVDSLEKPDNYIKDLHHMRFYKIDVIPHPAGRYSGYDVVINLHTKPNYEGYEGNLSHTMRLFPTDANGKGKNIAIYNSSASFTYTKNKWNFVTWVNYRGNQTESDDFTSEQTYKLNQIKETSLKESSAGKENKNLGAYVAADYQINPRHSLSLSYNYAGSDVENGFCANLIREYLDGGTQEHIHKKQESETVGGRHTWGAYYRGRTDAWHYELNFNYTHERSDFDYQFRQNEVFATEIHQKNWMNYVWLNTEMNRKFFDNKFYVGVGYTFNLKNYEQRDRSEDNLLSENKYVRHEFWTKLSYAFSPNTNANATFTAQTVRTSTTGFHETNLYYRMNGRIYHRFNKNIWATLNYYNNVTYPQLSQVTNYGYFTDSLSWRAGNPTLKTSVQHGAYLECDFFNLFSIELGGSYEPNRIQQIVESHYGLLPSGKEGYYSYSMPQNTRYRSLWACLYAYKQISDIRLNANLRYYHYKAWYKDMEHTNPSLAFQLSANYYNDKHKLSAYLSYNVENFSSASVQGWSDQKFDYLSMNVSKSFLNGHLYASLEYWPPLHFTRMKTKNNTETPAQKIVETVGLKKNNGNFFFFSIRYKFYGGKSVRQYQREMKDEK